LLLVWDFPRDSQPQPAAFVIDYTTSGTAQTLQMSVSLSGIGACAGDMSPNTYCAQWPQCPDPGVYFFWVHALWDTGDVSEKSNLATCQFIAAKPCDCQVVVETPTSPVPPSSTRVPTSSPPPMFVAS